MIIVHPLWYNFDEIAYIRTRKGIIMDLATFVKSKRKSVRLTQPELAAKAGVGLRFLRELEQGKQSLRLDKVNQVLKLFGYRMGPVPARFEPLPESPNTTEEQSCG